MLKLWYFGIFWYFNDYIKVETYLYFILNIQEFKRLKLS